MLQYDGFSEHANAKRSCSSRAAHGTTRTVRAAAGTSTRTVTTEERPRETRCASGRYLQLTPFMLYTTVLLLLFFPFLSTLFRGINLRTRRLPAVYQKYNNNNNISYIDMPPPSHRSVFCDVCNIVIIYYNTYTVSGTVV